MGGGAVHLPGNVKDLAAYAQLGVIGEANLYGAQAMTSYYKCMGPFVLSLRDKDRKTPCEPDGFGACDGVI